MRPKVLPSEFGTHKPWYFLVLPSYWCGSCGVGKTDTSVQAAQALADGESMDTVEPVIDTLSRQVPCVSVSTQRTHTIHLVTSSLPHPLPVCR